MNHGRLLQSVMILHLGPCRLPTLVSPGVIYTRKRGDLCCSGSSIVTSRTITREVSFSKRCFASEGKLGSSIELTARSIANLLNRLSQLSFSTARTPNHIYNGFVVFC